MEQPDTSWLGILHSEWPMIKAAPYSFCIAVIIVAAVCWGVIFWLFRQRIERKDDTIDHLERENGRLKEQLANTETVPKPLSIPQPQPQKKTLNVLAKKVRVVWVSEGGTGGNVFYEPEGKEMYSVKGILVDFRNEPDGDFPVLNWFNVKASVFYYDESGDEVADTCGSPWLEQLSPKTDLHRHETKRLIVAARAKDAWVAFESGDAKKIPQDIKRAKIVLHDDRDLECSFWLEMDLDAPMAWLEGAKPQ